MTVWKVVKSPQVQLSHGSTISRGIGADRSPSDMLYGMGPTDATNRAWRCRDICCFSSEPDVLLRTVTSGNPDISKHLVGVGRARSDAENGTELMDTRFRVSPCSFRQKLEKSEGGDLPESSSDSEVEMI